MGKLRNASVKHTDDCNGNGGTKVFCTLNMLLIKYNNYGF